MRIVYVELISLQSQKIKCIRQFYLTGDVIVFDRLTGDVFQWPAPLVWTVM